MQKRIAGEAYRTTILCVDAYEHGVPAGRFYHPYAEEGQSFCSLTELLLKMDRMLDEMKYPQSFHTVRSFEGGTEIPTGAVPEERPHSGELATFAIRIAFRQNSSWQGSVSWLEGRREQSFRSVLELIFLMNDALGGIGGGPSAQV